MALNKIPLKLSSEKLYSTEFKIGDEGPSTFNLIKILE